MAALDWVFIAVLLVSLLLGLLRGLVYEVFSAVIQLSTESTS